MPIEDQHNTQVHLTVNSLFIDGLNEVDLWEYFSRFGIISDVVIKWNSDGKLEKIKLKK